MLCCLFIFHLKGYVLTNRLAYKLGIRILQNGTYAAASLKNAASRYIQTIQQQRSSYLTVVRKRN
ncbi:hypothetical protein D3C74_408180 [compost metagenome]